MNGIKDTHSDLEDRTASRAHERKNLLTFTRNQEITLKELQDDAKGNSMIPVGTNEKVDNTNDNIKRLF